MTAPTDPTRPEVPLLLPWMEKAARRMAEKYPYISPAFVERLAKEFETCIADEFARRADTEQICPKCGLRARGGNE